MSRRDERYVVEDAVRALEATAANFASQFIKDAAVRAEYVAANRKAGQAALTAFDRGEMNARQAAEWASRQRNQILEISRLKSSPTGRAWAEAMKKEGHKLNYLCKKYAEELFGASFDKLNATQRNKVYLKIVEKSAQPQMGATRVASRLGVVGRGLWFMTAAIAVYNISTAEDKVHQAAKESVTVGSGIAGGVAGGAAAGLVCGPGAPVCVTVGAFVGGVIAALGADYVFEHTRSIRGDMWSSFEKSDRVHRRVTGKGLLDGPKF